MGKLFYANGLPGLKDLHKHAKTALKSFITDFMTNQDKIKSAADLVPGLLYKYESGVPGHATACVLWKGLGERAARIMGKKKDYDAQINVQVEPVDYDGACFVYIFQHKKNTEFLDPKNWKLKD